MFNSQCSTHKVHLHDSIAEPRSMCLDNTTMKQYYQSYNDELLNLKLQSYPILLLMSIENVCHSQLE